MKPTQSRSLFLFFFFYQPIITLIYNFMSITRAIFLDKYFHSMQSMYIGRYISLIIDVYFYFNEKMQDLHLMEYFYIKVL